MVHNGITMEYDRGEGDGGDGQDVSTGSVGKMVEGEAVPTYNLGIYLFIYLFIKYI